jgi:uncharacterized protein (TIGR00255 family)
MISSMTGYGKDTLLGENFTVELEIKSLNSRYLDLSVKLPKELGHYEYDIRDLLKSRVKRGKVTIAANVSFDQESVTEPTLNKKSLLKTVEYIKEITTNANVEESISLDHLLLLKEHFISESEVQLNIEWNELRRSVENALTLLLEMRNKEGEFLKIDISARLEQISKNIDEIESISKISTKEYFEKFRDKAKKLAEEFTDDHDRFMIELGILSEKHDVTEECIRLRSHLKIFNETFENPSDIGRRLNFICQEMNREINTINSKSISSEISHLGINMKEELEKIREQVQNIE